MTYKITHPDGRVNYPLTLTHYGPGAANATFQMLYTTMSNEIADLCGVSTIYKIDDKDILEDKWLIEQISKHKRC